MTRIDPARILPELGIIEGYFGPAWSWAERRAVVERLAPAGYGLFHYAPKADAHLRRDWRREHPVDTATALARLAADARAAGMRFGIGLTPYDLHLDFGAEGRAALARRLAQLDAIGIDDLAILFDDMRGDLPDLAERQAAIVAFCAEHSRATRLFTCPSYYSDDRVLDRVFGQRPPGYLEELGRRLDPAVQVYWTGEEVCARAIDPVISPRSPAGSAASRGCGTIGRSMTVRACRRICTCAASRPAGGECRWLAGHAINPALQPQLGCIPALTLPRLYADPDYRYMAAFRAAAAAVAGEPLAAMLEADLLSFEDSGLERLSPSAAAPPRARYAAIDHPVAAEVVRCWTAAMPSRRRMCRRNERPCLWHPCRSVAGIARLGVIEASNHLYARSAWRSIGPGTGAGMTGRDFQTMTIWDGRARSSVRRHGARAIGFGAPARDQLDLRRRAGRTPVMPAPVPATTPQIVPPPVAPTVMQPVAPPAAPVTLPTLSEAQARQLAQFDRARRNRARAAPGAPRDLSESSPEALVRIALDHAHAVHVGRLDPGDFQRDWGIRPQSYDPLPAFAER